MEHLYCICLFSQMTADDKTMDPRCYWQPTWYHLRSRGEGGSLTISLLEVLATEEDTVDLLPDRTKQMSREWEFTTHLIFKGYPYLHLSLDN